jgi:hypothetical protein
MPIPEFDPRTGWLPAGTHEATWEEIEARFGFNYRRRQMLADLSWVVKELRERGVDEIYLDGGFVSEKERTRDIDVVFVAPAGSSSATWGLLSPGRRAELKKVFRVHLWEHPSPQPASNSPGKYVTIKEFFETDRNGEAKGLVQLINGDSSEGV